VSGPLLTAEVHAALRAGTKTVSLDLGRSTTTVEADAEGWAWRDRRYPFIEDCKDRTVYYWTGNRFEQVARYGGALIKLVPTEWGAPTFEIDGIKMLPTAQLSPYEDAGRKVALIQPRSKAILDTCGGLGYFAAWCMEGGARQVLSFEKNADVLWLRSLNPWSPAVKGALDLRHGDITAEVGALPDGSFDAVLHDPPRFGIAGELYSQAFYDQLARVLKRKGRLFHYTGTPNKLTSGRDVPAEVMKRLARAGFAAKPSGDGVLATKT
jgi:predicted methyltransferase